MHADVTKAADQSTSRLLTSRSYPPTAADGVCWTFHYHLFGPDIGDFSAVLMSQSLGEIEVKIE